MVSFRAFWGGVVLVGCLFAVGCYQARKQSPDDPINVVRQDGGGGGGAAGRDGPGNTGGGGSGVAMPTLDAPVGPGGDGPFVCQAGGPCAVPDSPCLIGETRCEGETATCVKTDKPQANGTACGGDSVCLDGMCSPCQRGLECPIAGNACRVGAIECASGKPECHELGNAPNGASCGQGMVCKEGACAPCAAGDSCVPANACHEGTLACTGGVASCTDTARPKAAGTSCGTSKVCSAAGECVTCMAGMACDLPNQPCKVGKIDCSTGASTCVESGNASNGKSCGSGQVCSDGNCTACSAGMACTPNNRCHTGTLSCATGSAQCTDTNTNVANGTSCGTNLYCNNGTCNPCTPDVSCNTGNQCKTGTTSCATGTSQCRESGNAPNGRGCGNGRVCSNGTCVTCENNMPCEPSACRVGTTSCATGTSQCMATGNAPNGSSCGAGRVCNNGSCVPCNQGASCPPGNVCKRGTISCSTGSAQCMESGNVGDGTGCGGSRVCVGGACRDCNPDNQPTCRGGQRITCSSSGSEMVDNCAGNGCTGNRCNSCRPNSKRCSGSTSQTCRGDGSDYDGGTTCQVGCDTASGNCRTCGSNQHACDERCVSSNSPNSCGSRCSPCPDTSNGTPSCVNGQCSVNCDPGFRRDQNTCVRECGAVGQECCPSGTRCQGGSRVNCFFRNLSDTSQGGTCRNCGRSGERCCLRSQRDQECDEGLLCQGGPDDSNPNDDLCAPF